MSSRRSLGPGLASVFACLVAVFALASCGSTDDEPAAPAPKPVVPVAKVGDTVVTKRAFDHWMDNAFQSGQRAYFPVRPDPPRFSSCIEEARRKKLPGVAKLSDRQVRKRCADLYEETSDYTLRFLIQLEWLRQEADRQGVRPSPETLRRKLARDTRESFSSGEEQLNYLRGSGMSHRDLLLRTEQVELQVALLDKLTEELPDVSDADVDAYLERTDRPGGLSRNWEALRARLAERRKEKALKGFTSRIARRYMPRTHCMPGYDIRECADSHEPEEPGKGL